MKKSLTVTIFLISIVFGSAALAMAGGPTPTLLVNVPFAFNAGGQVFPAGEYIFRMASVGYSATGSLLVIESKDGAGLLWVNAIRSDARDFHLAYTATFNRYGDKYFLSEVQNGGIKSGLTKTRLEKELTLAYSGRSEGSSKAVVVASSTPE